MAVSEPFDEVVKLTDCNYYTVPSADELQLDLRGECWVQDFIVGHRIFGSAKFTGWTNIAGLNLSSIGIGFLFVHYTLYIY